MLSPVTGVFSPVTGPGTEIPGGGGLGAGVPSPVTGKELVKPEVPAGRRDTGMVSSSVRKSSSCGGGEGR